MFVVINELFVTDNNRATFERNFPASMHATLPGVPGLRLARLLHPREPGRGYLSILEFADDTAYAAYRASDAFHAAHNWPDHAPIDHSQLTTYHVHTAITATAEPRP
jgi:heme-degrading monooxygenase HmoA